MCRTGGRRCPGQGTPEGRAARNARRRAQYAAKKNHSTSVDNDGTSVIDENLKQPDKNLGQHVGGNDHLMKTMDNTHTMESLGEQMVYEENKAVDTTGHSGTGPFNLVVEPQYIPFTAPVGVMENKISGTIDYTKLDSESYQYFGFTKPEDERVFTGSYEQPSSYDMSMEECYGLDRTQEKIVRSFTNSAYLFMNEYAFNHDKIAKLPEQADLVGGIGWAPEEEVVEKVAKQGVVLDANQSRETLKKLSEILDTALMHGSGVQRKVYRGIGESEIEAVGNGDLNHVEEWVDEHRSVGTVLKFDGYTSTSTSPVTACDFSEGGYKVRKKVVYEIITPQGLAVESLTASSDENEVLLPREQEYAVVGVHKNFGEHQRIIVVQMVAVNSKGEILDGTNADPIPPLVP